MKLVVGLGNPGKKYTGTRHNIGFMVADDVAKRLEVSVVKKKFSSLFGIGKLEEDDLLIVEPQTYMNLSGEAVSSFVSYYKVAIGDMLIIHDDIDMPLGKMKFVFDSGAGGHNGVTSIIEQLGTKEFWRLKIGVGRPIGEMDPADYVLQKVSSAEKKLYEKIVDESSSAVIDFFKIGPDKAMMKYNGTLVSI